MPSVGKISTGISFLCQMPSIFISEKYSGTGEPLTTTHLDHQNRLRTFTPNPQHAAPKRILISNQFEKQVKNLLLLLSLSGESEF